MVSESFIRYPHYWSLLLKFLWLRDFFKGRILCRQPQNQTNLLSGALFSCRSVGRPVPCFVSDSFSLCIILFYVSFLPTLFSFIFSRVSSVPPTLIILILYELNDVGCLLITFLFVCLCHILWYVRYVKLRSLKLQEKSKFEGIRKEIVMSGAG